MSVELATEPELRLAKPKMLFVHKGLLAMDMSYDVVPDRERFLMVEEVEPPPPAPIEIRINWFQELERLVPKD